MTSTSPPPEDLAKRFLQAHAADKRLLQVALVGAHGCGYGAANAPLELKGVFVEPTENLVGMVDPSRTVHWVGEYEGHRIDYSAHEAGHAFRLLSRGDGSTLERILAPQQLRSTGDLPRLVEVADGAISQRCYGYYRACGRGMRQQEDDDTHPTLNHLLATYRTALTGTHLLRTGKVLLDLGSLADLYGLSKEIGQLIQTSRHQEDAAVQLRGPWAKLLVKMQALLEESIDVCELPPDPRNAPALQAYLLDLRRRFFDADTLER